MKPIVFTLLLLLLFVPVAADDWALTGTQDISTTAFGLNLSYPAGWLTEKQQTITAFNELEADQATVFDDKFVTQGYSITFEFVSQRALRGLALQPTRATPAELFAAIAQREGYATEAEPVEISYLGWPAVRAETVDASGNFISTVQGLMGGSGYVLTLFTPSQEKLDAFLSTWDAVLAGTFAYRGMFPSNGENLSFECKGEGSPTVVLEHGWNASSVEGISIMPGVQKFTRICALNRRHDLGMGGVTQHVDDLHNFLVTAGIPGPYVLVGHSYGGVVVRVFAGRYPDDVAGMVLVDSAQEDQLNVLAEILPPGGVEQFMQGITVFDDSLAEVAKVTSLGDIPLVVLTADTPSDTSAPFTQETADAYQKIWIEDLQARLAALSTDGQQIVVPGTIHFTILSNLATTDAIRNVVEAVRAKAS